MFTGIVEDIGTILEITSKGSIITISIGTDIIPKDISLGDSIAVNGVCLTVTNFCPSSFTADIQAETVRKSNLKELKANDTVNLERALTPSKRLGGHFVLGHIDNTGTILKKEKTTTDYIVQINAPESIMKYIVEKGSITIDGISLTIGGADKNSFWTYIIPHTLENTTLKNKKVGDTVNLETDILGKYIYKFTNKENDSNIDMNFLSQTGFI